jgi:hypothetical protein
MYRNSVIEILTHSDKRQRAGFIWFLMLACLFAASKAVLWDNLDPDLGWHLRVAEQLHEDGIGPLVDRLSYNSVREPWTPYSWLAQLGMKWVWDVGGAHGILITHATLQALLFALIGLTCVEASRSVRGSPGYMAAGVAVILAGLYALAYLSFRPVLLALVLLAATMFLIFRDRRLGRSRAVWLVIPIALLCANVHLYVVILVAIVWAMAVGAWMDRWSGVRTQPIGSSSSKSATRLTTLAILTSLAALGTPMLPGLVRQAWTYQKSDVMVASDFIDEMRPFWSDLGMGTGLSLLAIVTMIAIALRFRIVGFGPILVCGIGLVCLMKLGRFAPIFAILGLPMFACLLTSLSDRVLGRGPVRVMLAAMCALCLVRIVDSLPRAEAKDRFETVDRFVERHGAEVFAYPGAAVRFVEQNIAPKSGRIINEFNWGGFLAWRLGDRYQVFMDGRTQLYPAWFWRVTCLDDAASARPLLIQSNADLAILPVRKSRFADVLIDAGWHETYRDEFASVLLPPETSAVVQSHDANAGTTDPDAQSRSLVDIRD